MIELEHALRDLGDHLDAPSGDDLVARVVAELTDPDGASGQRSMRRSLRRTWMVAAAIVVALLVASVIVAPARNAIAQWLGVGAVEVHHDPDPPTALPSTGAAPVPGAADPGTSVEPATIAAQIADAQAHLGFAIRLPHDPTAGTPTQVIVDDRPPGGLIAITYERLAVVEVASSPNSVGVLRKGLSANSTAEPVTVSGSNGFWITGDPHTIGYLDREDRLVEDTVRRAGDVLLWAVGDVTFRIEGLPDLAAAQRVAASMT